MYNPTRYRSADENEAFQLMEKYPFATVITVVEGKPVLSLLPVTPKQSKDGIVLIGHLAKANPQWKSLANGQVTVLFQGPHTYITPAWYTEGDVPTWNYSAVTVTGQSELIEDLPGLIECLKAQTTHIEKNWPSGWEFTIPDDLAGDALGKHIAGFRIHVTELNFKKKLSQNRSAVDRVGVLKGLEARTDENSQAVLVNMLSLYSEDGMMKG